MEDLTLSSVGASFKKWEYCTSIFPKGMAYSPNFQNKFKNNQKNLKEGTRSDGRRAVTAAG
jgi:hypothetical protein